MIVTPGTLISSHDCTAIDQVTGEQIKWAISIDTETGECHVFTLNSEGKPQLDESREHLLQHVHPNPVYLRVGRP